MIRLAQLTIPVSDLSASVAFYEAAFGAQAVFVSQEYGWAQLDGLAVGLALYVPGKGGGTGKLGGSLDFQLVAESLKEVRDQLPASATNVGFYENADGSTTLEFADLDGNEVKMFQGASA